MQKVPPRRCRCLHGHKPRIGVRQDGSSADRKHSSRDAPRIGSALAVFACGSAGCTRDVRSSRLRMRVTVTAKSSARFLVPIRVAGWISAGFYRGILRGFESAGTPRERRRLGLHSRCRLFSREDRRTAARRRPSDANTFGSDGTGHVTCYPVVIISVGFGPVRSGFLRSARPRRSTCPELSDFGQSGATPREPCDCGWRAALRP